MNLFRNNSTKMSLNEILWINTKFRMKCVKLIYGMAMSSADSPNYSKQSKKQKNRTYGNFHHILDLVYQNESIFVFGRCWIRIGDRNNGGRWTHRCHQNITHLPKTFSSMKIKWFPFTLLSESQFQTGNKYYRHSTLFDYFTCSMIYDEYSNQHRKQISQTFDKNEFKIGELLLTTPIDPRSIVCLNRTWMKLHLKWTSIFDGFWLKSFYEFRNWKPHAGYQMHVWGFSYRPIEIHYRFRNQISTR